MTEEKTRSKIMDGLARAERALFTRPAPKSPRSQMKFLRKREKGSTKSLAERLGVSRKTVQRYLSGASSKPTKRLREALAQETESEWQPQVRAQARQRAVTSGGLVISCRAYFGFGPEGTSDEGQVRDISVAVSPSHADEIATFLTEHLGWSLLPEEAPPSTTAPSPCDYGQPGQGAGRLR
jgi:transcriptional regulator with XRE-family HTH domain